MIHAIIQRPIIAVAIAFALGCVVAMVSGSAPAPGLGVAGIGCAAAIYAFARGQRGWVVLLVGVALLGFARASVEQTPGRSDVSRFAGRRTPVVLDGYIASDPQITPETIRFFYRVSAASANRRVVPASGKISVSVARQAAQTLRRATTGLTYGRTLRLRAQIRRPSQPRNPGEFSWASYLARHGAFATAWVDSPTDITVLDEASGPQIVVWAYRLRDSLRAQLARHLPRQEAALASGMVLGSYSLVPQKIVESFTRTGTLHLLAASGYNCALIVTIFWGMLLRRSRFPRLLSTASVILLIFFYTLMAGAGPSIVRAGIASSLYMAALMLGRPADMISVLAATVAIMLAIDPLSLADVGFQLSFAAVVSILMFAPRLNSLTARFEPAPSAPGRAGLRKVILLHLRDVAVVTTAATVATAPLIANYFNRLSLVSLPANVAVAAVAEWFFVATVALSALFWVPYIGWLISQLVFGLAVAVETIVGTMASPGFAEINVRSPGVFGLVAWFALLGAVWWYWRLPRRASVKNASRMSTGTSQ